MGGDENNCGASKTAVSRAFEKSNPCSNSSGLERFAEQTEIANNAIIVLGMHRSGTSALTGMLSMLGANPGSALMPADEEVNPKGFWEHKDIVTIDDKLLEALGSFWHDERSFLDSWWQLPMVVPFRRELVEVLRRDFSQSPLWIVKDPRICRLLPMWLDALQETGSKPHFVIMVRDPIEVVQSLKRRDGFSESKSYLLWLEHLLDAELWSRGHPRVVVSYDQLLGNWQNVSHQIAQGLGLLWPVDERIAVSDIQSFLESDLRHHHALGQQTQTSRLATLANDAYFSAMNTTPDELGNSLTEASRAVAQICHVIDPWSCQIEALKIELVQELERSATFQREIDRLKSTFSWRMTKPLRAAWNCLHAFRRGP